jgi:hypothetical protein
MTSTAIKIAVPLLWSGFILWSVARIWRGRDAQPHRAYQFARMLAVFTTLGFAVLFPLEFAFPGVPYWMAAIVFAVITFPLALWLGYLVGVIAGRLTGRF